MNKEIQVRPLDDGDIDLILASDAFDNAPTPEATAAFLADPNHLIVGAIDAGRLIGFATGAILLHPDKAPAFFVSEVGVNDTYRRQGIGTRLCAMLLDAARRRGCQGIWLATETENAPARGLYRALAARETGGIVVYDWDGAMDRPGGG